MSVNITQKTDYTKAGEFSVGLNTNENDNIEETITQTEESTLECLLGARLYNEFQTDLAILNNGTPTAQKWLDFVNGVNYVDLNDSSYTINYKGIVRALKGFVFYHYVNIFQFKRTSTGVRMLNAENSSDLDRGKVNGIIEPKYNESVKLSKAAQSFIEDFEEYEATATSIVEAAGTYTVTIADTKYLADGDTVTIDGNDYTVANLIDDTSFEFTAATGLSFSSLVVEWQPFADFKPSYFQIIPFC